jgi:hypothetical protein
MTPKRGNNDDYPPTEAQRKHDAALRAALSMPAIPDRESNLKKKKTAQKKRARVRP